MLTTNSRSYGVVFVGWCLAGLTNDILLTYLNMGAILALGAFLQLLAHTLRFWTPPFGVFCTGFALAALGVAYQDSHSNTLVSSVKGAHKWLAYVHACYAFGTLVAPFMANGIATAAMKSGHGWTWSLFYLAPMGMGVVNLAFVLFAFRDCLFWSQKVEAERLVRSAAGTSEHPDGNKKPLRTLWETVKLSFLLLLPRRILLFHR
jgi:fucose permease